ncbi:MAG: hypothetical protein PHQ25_07875 [Acidobacteriota bacterium]|nr:hypothetical protein [Acidobacteriota bacterium]
MNKKLVKLVLGCAGRMGIFGSTFPSTIGGNSKPDLEKISRMAVERRRASLKPFEAPKKPKITQTSPSE